MENSEKIAKTVVKIVKMVPNVMKKRTNVTVFLVTKE